MENTQNKKKMTEQERHKLLLKRKLSLAGFCLLITASAINVLLGIIYLVFTIIAAENAKTVNSFIPNTFTAGQITFYIATSVVIGLAFISSIAWLVPMALKSKKHAKRPSYKSCLTLSITSFVFGGLFAIILATIYLILGGNISLGACSIVFGSIFGITAGTCLLVGYLATADTTDFRKKEREGDLIEEL